MIHGKLDDVVPWQRSQEVIAKLTSKQVDTCWIEDGDHRLSRPKDLQVLTSALYKLAGDVKKNTV